MGTTTSTSTPTRTFAPGDDVVGVGFKVRADERDALADLAWRDRTSRSDLLRRFMREGLERAGKLPQREEGAEA